MEQTWYIIANWIIDAAFFMDIIINFRVSFINEKGDEINEPKAIALNYLKEMFWIDLVATIPMEDILSILV